MPVRLAIEYFAEAPSQKIGILHTDFRSEQLIAIQLSIVKGRDTEIMNTAEFDWPPGISLKSESLRFFSIFDDPNKEFLELDRSINFRGTLGASKE